jgi:YgiT-type zinc finger domain-containing protein
MMCPICEKGKLKKETVDVVRHGIFVGHFKAEVCNTCGEQIFDSREAGRIESKMKELGLFGAEKAAVYKIGGNFAISLKASIAKALGITKNSKPIIIAQEKEKRLIVELG